MHKLIKILRERRDVALLCAALLLLLIAMLRPAVPIKRDIHTYLLVIDITQSMNVSDMAIDGKSATRIEYTRKLLHDSISSMPCNSRVGVALFAGVIVYTLFSPVEVCANFAAIQETIEHVEWRQAWHGNSRLAFGILSAATALNALPEPAQVVFFTDGEEAPLLHAFNRADLSHWQGGSDWLLVGIGGDKPSPVPKMDENNKVVGYWSGNVSQLDPGIVQVSEETRLQRDDNIATHDYERYLSKLDEKYLLSLSSEIGARYLRGEDARSVISAMRSQKPAKQDITPVDIYWLPAMLAALCLIRVYVPRHIFTAIRQRLRG